jgi:hypothetical protein
MPTRETRCAGADASRPPKPTGPNQPLPAHHLTAHRSPHTTAHHHLSPPALCPPPICSPPCHLPSLQAAAAATFLHDPNDLLVWREDGSLPIHSSAGMAGMVITEAQKQAALRVLDALAGAAGDTGMIASISPLAPPRPDKVELMNTWMVQDRSW